MSGADVSQVTGAPRRDFVQTLAEWVYDKPAHGLKILMYGTTWIEFFQGKKFDPTSTPAKIRGTATALKLFDGGFRELPKKVWGAGVAIEKAWSNLSFKAITTHLTPQNFSVETVKEGVKEVVSKNWGRVREATFKLLDCVSPALDSMELLEMQNIAKVPARIMNFAKKVNGPVMVTVFAEKARVAHGKYKTAQETDLSSLPESTEKDRAEKADKIEEKRVTLNKQWYDRANAISYIALGILLTAIFIFGIVVPPIATTAAATSALVFAILGYYSEKWGARIPAVA